MQQHTGQHLLSAVLLKEYGYATESFHLGAEYSSIDISTSSFPVDEQTRVEEVVNSIIFQNVPIHIYWAAQAELDKLPLRKVPDLEGDLRIVEISGWESFPLLWHASLQYRTLSLFKLLRTENYKGYDPRLFPLRYAAFAITNLSTQSAASWVLFSLCPLLCCDPHRAGAQHEAGVGA